MHKLPSEMGRSEFVQVFGGLFEHSPWVVEQAFDAGVSTRHDSADALHGAFLHTLGNASRERQLELIRAHPELGDRVRVKTRESAGEQRGAGLDDCSTEQYEDIKKLNSLYGQRFGFPFILAVKGKTPAHVIETIRARLNNATETEFEVALAEIGRIARFRLADLVD